MCAAFCNSVMIVSTSLTGTIDDSIELDLRLFAFVIGLWRTRADGPALLGAAAFFLDFLATGSGKAVSRFMSIGEVAFELGAVLGFV